MANTKIILQVNGGCITGVFSTSDIDVCIVDFDNIQNGAAPINGILAQDRIFESGKAYELYTDMKDPEEVEVRDELKRIAF